MINKNDIKAAIARRGLKSQDVAAKMGLCKQNFSSLTAKQKLTQQDLIRIADALGVRYVSAFIDENGQTLAGGVCDVSELEEIDRKPTGAAAHKSKLNAPKDTK